MQAYFHALCLRSQFLRSTSWEDDSELYRAVGQSKRFADESLAKFMSDLRQVGWHVDRILLRPGTPRVILSANRETIPTPSGSRDTVE